MLTKNRASAMAYHKPPLVEKPDRPCPHVAHDHHKDLWYPYPAQSDGYSTHPLCHFNNLCELTIVINNWCQFLFGDSDKPAFDRVKELTESVDRRLSEWQQGLPPCLDLNIEGALLPQVLCLQYVSNSILIFKTWSDATSTACIIITLSSPSSALPRMQKMRMMRPAVPQHSTSMPLTDVYALRGKSQT